jgi:lanthionine synthetase-like protein
MSSSRPSHLVQLCHGSPGLLVLLATARRHASLSTYWQPEWDEAIYLGTERVWEEGLLSKGGSLCHGLTGNAWPLLMLHDSFEYAKDLYSVKRTTMENTTVPTKRNSSNISSETLSSDYFLSRALAFLRLAQECPPYSTDLGIKASYHFRMPDRPYGLYEGLAGMVCAWAEACAVIQARLRKMEIDGAGEEAANKLMDDGIFESYMLQQLGVPGLGGQGPNGLL